MSETKVKNGNWFSRHKVLTVIIGVIILFIVIGVANSGGDTSTTGTAPESSSGDTAQADKSSGNAKIGEPARDGKFEFVVSKVECGKATIGTIEYLKKDAQGEFCLLDISVKNIGDEPQTLLDSDQYVYNAEEQKYSTSSGAMFALDDAANVWLQEINPGNQINGKLVYDVPKGTVLVAAELHDSSFSSGVKVDLQ